MVGENTFIAQSGDNWQTLTNVMEKKGTMAAHTLELPSPDVLRRNLIQTIPVLSQLFVSSYVLSGLQMFLSDPDAMMLYVCNELGDLGVGWNPNRPTTAIQVFQRTQTQSSDGIMI